jgi:alkylresorcinol/alkylpyrone synthase
MGWEFDDQGCQIVLASDVPAYASGPVCQGLHAYLEEHGLKPSDIHHWVAHPGGPKVMQALEEGLGIAPALDVSRRSLAEVGNLSSVSVLCILDELLRSGRPQPGDWGVLMAMGPAFCAEIVLLRWQ